MHKLCDFVLVVSLTRMLVVFLLCHLHCSSLYSRRFLDFHSFYAVFVMLTKKRHCLLSSMLQELRWF